MTPDNDCVICPNCVHQFRAIPVNVQTALSLAQSQLAEASRALSQCIAERDTAEETIGEMYMLVMGEQPEWSNHFNYNDALEEVEGRIAQAERERDELREVLRYWREECSGAEPSLSVFERKVDQALSAPEPAAPSPVPDAAEMREPVAMLLYCPRCQMQHVDAADTEEEYTRKLHESAWWELGGEKPARWTNPPHATHTCKGCGLNWRPSNAPTVGVAAIPVAELGSEAKHIERMEATNPTLYVAPSSSAAEMRERAAKVCDDLSAQFRRAYESGAGLDYRGLCDALDRAATTIRQLPEKEG